MKKTLKFTVLLLIICLVSGFSACSPKNNEQRSRYVIDAVYNDTDKTLTANMTVDFYNCYDIELEELMFHLYPAAYRQGARFSPVAESDKQEAYPNGESYGSITVSEVKENGVETVNQIGGQDEDILVVKLSEKLQPTESTTVSMKFTLSLPNMRHRLGYMDDNVNFGNWYPVVCVYKDGKFDTTPYYSIGDPFILKTADYKVTVTYPETMTLAACAEQSIRQENGNKISVIEAQNIRDFAFVLGKFDVKTATASNVTVNYYYYDDVNADDNLTAAIDAVNTFTDMFGNLPFATVSVVKTSFLQGGMEYPGLVYISDSLNQSRFIEVIVHEISHQWWACAVGNDQISEAWIDEALAEYSTNLFYEKNSKYGITKADRVADALSSFILYCDLYKNNGKDETSFNRPLNEYASGMEYNYMVYVKGSLMFESLYNSIGETKFLDGLKIYYKDYKNGFATADCLIGAFEKSTGRDLGNFVSSWADGKVGLYAGQ